jgi:hypothetical protein
MSEIDDIIRSSIFDTLGDVGFVFDACTLHPAVKTADGALTGEFGANISILSRFSRISDMFRLSTEVSAKERGILALQKDVATAPTIDDQITVDGTRWAIKSVDADSASATWRLRAEPA